LFANWKTSLALSVISISHFLFLTCTSALHYQLSLCTLLPLLDQPQISSEVCMHANFRRCHYPSSPLFPPYPVVSSLLIFL
jgi:hypothetical protein